MATLERAIRIRPGAPTYLLVDLLQHVVFCAEAKLTGNLEPEGLLALVSHVEQLAGDLDTAIKQRDEAQAAVRMVAGNVRAAQDRRPLAHDPLPMTSFLSESIVARVLYRQSCSCTVGILAADTPEKAKALFEIHRAAVLNMPEPTCAKGHRLLKSGKCVGPLCDPFGTEPRQMATYPAPPQDGNGALLTEEL